MPVWGKNGREIFRFVGFRAKEQAGHEETGDALEVNFLNGKARAFDFAMNDRIQRGFFRHRPQAVCHKEAKFELLRTFCPSLTGCRGIKGKESVEVLGRAGSDVLSG